MQALLDHEVEEDAMFAEEADDHDFHAKGPSHPAPDGPR